MSRKYRRLLFTLISFFLFAAKVFCEDWTIAAMKFSYGKGQESNSVNDALAELLPTQILEKLGQNIVREVHPDEKLERTRYELRSKRLAYFLQLSSEYKKRDSIVLYDYSDRTRTKKIKEQEKKIEEIKQNIDDNLEELRLTEEKTQTEMELAKQLEPQNLSPNEFKKFTSLLKNLFNHDEELVTAESVKFYQNDYTKLYTPSSQIAKENIDSYNFEKAIVDANIRTLLTGIINIYGDYISVSVEAYGYPGTKKLGALTEVGTIGDIDFITTSLARGLLPLITNSMPLILNIHVEPQSIAKNVQLYIDDVLQNSIIEDLVIDSGVHSLQFSAKGYEPVAINYYWEANSRYDVQVTMQELQVGELQVALLKPVLGEVYANGELSYKDENYISHIKINGKNVLGEFVIEDNKNQLFYIPESANKDGTVVGIKPYLYDRSKYIDVSRKIMYGSYSLLITSLVPAFYFFGNYYNAAMLYNNGFLDYETALEAQKKSYIFSGISIGCGVLFGATLIHYLFAANTVLPQKAKVIKPEKMDKVLKVSEKIEVLENEKSELQNKNETENEQVEDEQIENKQVEDEQVEQMNTEIEGVVE